MHGRAPRSECCGALEYYDKAFDRITTRSEKPLRSIKRIFHTVTTTDDPVIRKVRAARSSPLPGAQRLATWEPSRYSLLNQTGIGWVNVQPLCGWAGDAGCESRRYTRSSFTSGAFAFSL